MQFAIPQDEEVILYCTNCSTSVFTSVNGKKKMHPTDVVLTNKQLFIEYKEKLFSKTHVVDSFSLTEIKQSKKGPQVKYDDDEECLKIHFKKGTLILNIYDDELSEDEYYKQWVEEIIKAYKDLTARPATEGACPNCGKALQPFFRFCTNCGMKISKGKTEPPNNSINQQIELLQKLKMLLDTGVLTQEEFDEKKKHILQLD